MSHRTTTLLPLLLAAALAPAAASAQREAGRRVGLGVGIESLNGGTIYVPINVGPSLRVEPQVGLLAFEGDPGDDFSRIDLGVGFLFRMPVSPAVQSYVGPRLVLSFVSDEENVGGGEFQDASGIDVRVVGALGGEYYPHPAFSFGVEAQLGFTAVGDRETDAGLEDSGGTSIHTGAVLFFRVFLF
jgi:hypothetical protein